MTSRLPETLDGPTLRLRPIADDADDLAAVRRIFCADPLVTRFVAWQPKRTDAEARRFLQILIDGRDDERPTWLLTRHDDGAVVGSIIAARDGNEVEVSYTVERAHWGRGHATEAVDLVAQAALEDADVTRIRAFCDAENAASTRVLEKAGFDLAARLPRHGIHNISAEPRDCLLFVRQRT